MRTTNTSAPAIPQFPHEAPTLPRPPDFDFPDVPKLPGRTVGASTGSKAGQSRSGPLAGESIRHVREKGGTGFRLASHRQLADGGRRDGEQSEKLTTASTRGAGFSPDASLAATSKSPKMRLIESPKSPQSPFKVGNKFSSHPRTPVKGDPKMASLAGTPGTLQLDAASNFRLDRGSEPVAQPVVPRKKTRKPANPRAVKKEGARESIVEKIKPAVARLAQLPLPASRLAKETLQNEAIRGKLISFELRKAFGGLPVTGARFDDQGRVCAMHMRRKNSAKSKWISIEWENGTPRLKERVLRLRDTTSKSLKNRLDGIAANIKNYDELVFIDPNAERDLCLQRAIKAIEAATALLPDLPKDAGSTLLRGGFQGLRYTVGNQVGFKDAYISCRLSAYFEGMGKEELIKHVDALLVEAFKDVRQVVAGCVSPEQIIELIKLFPENPPKGDERICAEVNADTKNLIQSKLKKMLGDYHQLVGGLFCLVNVFQKLAVSVLEDESLISLAKNFWRTNMLLFGVASQQMDMAYGENDTAEARRFGSQKLMWAFHLSNHAADYFGLDA